MDAEDAWNTRDPQRVAAAYTADSQWRNRSEFVRGRAEIVAFLTRKWQREQDYALRKNLWTFTADRIAVRFQYKWHDDTGAPRQPSPDSGAARHRPTDSQTEGVRQGTGLQSGPGTPSRTGPGS